MVDDIDISRLREASKRQHPVARHAGRASALARRSLYGTSGVIVLRLTQDPDGVID